MAALVHWLKRPSGRRAIVGYVFIMPFVLGFLLWFLIPALTSVWLTFQDWNMIRDAKFVGLGNFRKVFSDKLFWQALKVTAIYTVISVPLGMVLAFTLAMLMNTKVRGITIFRTIYYLPSIVPAVGLPEKV